MGSNYEKIVQENLLRVFQKDPDYLAKSLPARKEAKCMLFRAFGEDCCLTPDEVRLSGVTNTGPKGLIISLYAVGTSPAPMALEPFCAFKDLPGSMPYQGAFSANSEGILIPYVLEIKTHQENLLPPFQGAPAPEGMPGDFSFVLYPLPKIALAYVFYLPDEEFPASVTCLLSSNASDFMPLDGLADVAEYTSRRIIRLLEE
jgi:hypothetical protein